MSTFEQYSAGAPLFFPTKRFLLELMQAYDEDDEAIKAGGIRSPGRATAKLNSRYWTQFHTYSVCKASAAESSRLNEMVANKEASLSPHPCDPARVQIAFGREDRSRPTELEQTMQIQWWVDKADYYDAEWMPFVKYFDSWEDLVEITTSDPDPEEHCKRMAWLVERRGKILSKWRQSMSSIFPQAESFAIEQDKKVKELRKKNINEKQVLWEETLVKVPKPSEEKTRWGLLDGMANNSANLSLVLVEPREHPWMRAALHNACEIYGGSGARLYIFHSKVNKAFVEDIVRGWSGVNLVDLPKDNFSLEDYNRMLCSTWFYEHFPTTHCLVFQTDVLMRRRIPDHFFRFHYVGAPWHHLPVCSFTETGAPIIWHGHGGKKVVGNGGASLRHVAAMKTICSSFPYAASTDHFREVVRNGRFVQGGKLRMDDRAQVVNEDVWIASHVAPDKLPLNHEAAEFSVEHIWHPNPCLMHRAYGSWECGPRMYTTEMLAVLLETISDPKRPPNDHSFADRKSCVDRLHPNDNFVAEPPLDFGAFEVVWGRISKRGSMPQDYFLHPCDMPLPEGASRAADLEECQSQPPTLKASDFP